ncbi:hypothetical protein LXL04_010975 [Taraxacum kok-saghyz]
MGSRGGGGSNGGGSQGIPAASRRMVQSLKEIVNGVPEAEIYSTLKDCNMDPNEAVNRLLSQDTFHEVKSKREKKKELKDTPEYTQYRPRGGGSTSNRGGRSGTDRYAGRSASGSNQFTSSEYGGSHGKPAYKRENATSSFTNSTTPASKVAPPHTTNWNPPTFSDSHGHENEASTHNASVPQPYQSAWSVVPPGQKSMADIVKMGRPQNSYNYTNPPPQTASHNHAPPPPPPPTALPSSDNHASSPDNDWPSMEPPQPVNLHSVTNIQSEPAINSGQSNLQFESNNQYVGHETNEVEVEEESSSEEEQEEDYEDESHEGNLDISAEQDDTPVSSLTANLQNLDVHEETHLDPPQEDAHAPSVVIPGHLQVHTADCSHLSFGSFGVNMNQGHSGHFASTADANPEPEPEQEPVSSSVEHHETTNLEYYEDGSTRTMDRSENYELPSASQTALKQDDHEVTRGSQYGFPPATHTQSHAFDSSQLLNVMAANGHPVRESDLSSYSQLMPGRYANSASPINDPTISMAEALKNVGLTSSSSSLSSSQHTHPAGPTVPQHLTMHHPYSQPTVPLGPFPNMISYPFLPQSYTYMPSGFQPAYAGNTTTYHQQLAAAAMLPQYKNTLPTTLPQSASVPNPPGYASFGGSSPVPGNYEEVLNAHYKDTNNHLLSLQQNEWVHGGGSRTMAVPASAYYNLQSQNHQHHQQQQQQQQVQPPSGFRQGGQQQQPSQGGYGGGGVGLNYPDFFHSQGGGVSQEHLLQQNVRDGGAQGGQQKLQSQQFWQNGY